MLCIFRAEIVFNRVMFLETVSNKGSIEVICGCMFSGKTEELIRRVKRARIAGLNTLIFKPKIDVRYSVNEVVSHNDNSVESIAISGAKEILKHYGEARVIGIDEIQFFDAEIIEICKFLAYQNRRVIVAGLDMDFMGRPFGAMPDLMAIGEFVTKLHAICKNCGNTATHSYRKTLSNKMVEIGETNIYEARCRSCFAEALNLKEKQMALFSIEENPKNT